MWHELLAAWLSHVHVNQLITITVTNTPSLVLLSVQGVVLSRQFVGWLVGLFVRYARKLRVRPSEIWHRRSAHTPNVTINCLEVKINNHLRSFTPWVKKKLPPNFCLYLHQVLTDFKNSFTGTLCGKFAVMLLLNIPPHLYCVATLPCEI